MPGFSPDVKKLPGAAYCALRLLITWFFGWNTFSEWSTRKTDRPQTLLGKPAAYLCFSEIIYFKYVLESHMVECSVESFMHKDFRSSFICFYLQNFSWRFLLSIIGISPIHFSEIFIWLNILPFVRLILIFGWLLLFYGCLFVCFRQRCHVCPLQHLAAMPPTQ